MNKLHPFIVIIAAIAAIVLAMTGCGPYRLGTTLPANLQTVYVPTFENKTFQPGIEVDVTNAVITRFRQDGNLRPVSKDQADTILEGVITDWNRRVLGYTGDDENEVEEYRLYVTAVITFKELSTGEVLIKGQRVRGYTDFYVEADLPTEEEDARPKAFKDLARRIVDQVVSIW